MKLPDAALAVLQDHYQPSTEVLRATALEYVNKGYHVFPLRPGTKVPAGRHGQDEATTDPSQIKSWWSNTPNNIGINMQASGVLGIDIDNKTPDGPNGYQGWAAATRGVLIPDTAAQVATPSGGQHLYYRHDYKAAALTNSAGKFADGVDVRANGYLVAPGSYVNGAYSLPSGDDWGPIDLPAVADLPETTPDLVRVITRERKTPAEPADAATPTLPGARLGPEGQWAALFREGQALATTGAGGRNDALNTCAMRLAQIATVGGAAYDREAVLAALKHACETNGLIGEDGYATFAATFESGWGKGSSEPRALANLDDRREQQIANEMERIEIRNEAQRRVRDCQATKDFENPGPLVSLTDDLAAPRDEESWAIEGLIPTGGNLVIAAAYKTGKTTLVQNLIRSLADHEPFLGQYPVTTLTGRVALFNFELTRTQQLTWLDESGIANQETVVLKHLRGMRGVLTTEAGRDWAVEQLRANNVQTWVVDPFARAASGIDENSNTEVGQFLEALDEVKRRAGVSELVLITHTGRGNADEPARARGATRLNDWADTNMVVTKTAGGQRSFVAEGRDVWISKTLLAYDAVTRQLTTANDEANQEGLLRAVLQHIVTAGAEGVTTRGLRDAEIPGVRRGKDTRDPLVHQLVHDGLISRDGPLRGGHKSFVATDAATQTEMDF